MLRSHPLVPAAIFFTGGVWAAHAFELGPAILLGLLLVGVVLRRRTHAWLLILAIGAVIYWARYAPFFDDDLRVLLNEEPRIVTVRGELLETPQVRDFSDTEFSTARLKVTGILLNDAWQSARGIIMTRTRGALNEEDFFQSRQVEVSGVIAPPPRARAEGLFDYRKYLHNARIFYQLQANAPSDWNLSKPQAMPQIERLRRWAKWQLSRGLPEDEQVRMLWAMTLGWKSALSGEMAEPFMRTGTMHIIAISGLHVACIAGILVFAMQIVGLSRHQCAAVVIPLLWFYTITTGWQSSGVRSALMSTAVIGGWSLKRPTALLNSTAGAALLILVFQPEQLFQAGFQLSFAVVMSIGLLVPSLEQKLGEELPRDRFLPKELRAAWVRILERCYFLARPSLIVSLACFIGSTPLVAYYFNLFTPISLVANLIAVPISSLALLFSMLSLVLSPLGELLNFFSWAFMWETIVVARVFERIGGYFYVPKPNLLFAILYVALFVALFRGWLWRRDIRLWANAGIVLLALACYASARPIPSIHVLPSAGAPVWIDLPGRKNDLLLDCSDDGGFEYQVKRILRAKGVGIIPNLLLTHGDVEHVGGFLAALKEFDPGTIFIGPHPSRSPYYRTAVRLLAERPHKRRIVRQGETVLGWRVLHPAEKRFSRADDNGLVLQGEIEGWRVLYLGDLGVEGQRSLLASDRDLATDLLIIGSATSGERLRETLRQRTSPAVVISEKRLEWNGAGPFFNTEDDGQISVEFERGECRIVAISGRKHELLKAAK